MGNSLIVRRNTSLANRDRVQRAAQYVRMSTELQRYSIQNQAAAIAAYARQKNLTIVRTYVDEGRSGLRIKGRPGLAELIEDVQSGRAEFDHVLVYDVSRWGRFQDVDESAHYEFVCKQGGVKIIYCAEQFDNDGSLLASIVKNIKRVMAAEYSRELSVKVHTGQCRVASLGYRVGGPLGFGLRREMVDESERSKGRLTRGERKALQTDRVRVRPGSDYEATVVQWIFHQFAVEGETYAAIARQLNQAGIANHNGRPWTDGMIPTIIKNENYVGNIIYNRTSRRLGQKQIHNPPHLWVRGSAAIDPIVDQSLFASAQKLRTERRIEIPEDQMLQRLRVTLARRGKLNSRIINQTIGLPSVSAFVKHFGSLRKAYALIGHETSRDCDWIDVRDMWARVLAEHAAKLASAILEDGLAVRLVDSVGLLVQGGRRITVLGARQSSKRGADHAAQWRAYRKGITAGSFVVLRLDAKNRAIHDYAWVPASVTTGRYIWLSDDALARYNAVRFAEFDELITAIRCDFRESATRRKLSARRTSSRSLAKV